MCNGNKENHLCLLICFCYVGEVPDLQDNEKLSDTSKLNILDP